MGIITDLLRSPNINGEPDALVAITAHATNLKLFSTWHPDAQGSGCNFNMEIAKESAIGEAIERYSGRYPNKDIFEASFTDVKNLNVNFLNPYDLLAINDSQIINNPDLEIFDEDKVIKWKEGKDLLTNELFLLPDEVVSLHRELGVKNNFIPRMGGIASGRTFEQAITSGLLELLERDATARWWVLGEPCVELKGSISDIVPLEGMTDSIQIRIFKLDTFTQSASTICAVLIDKELDIPFAGFACRTTLKEAIPKAIGECFQLRRIAVALLDPDSWAWGDKSTGRIAAFPLVPYRKDRKYGDDLKNPQDMTQLIHNLQLALDKRSHNAFFAHLDSSIGQSIDIRNIPDNTKNFKLFGNTELSDLGPIVWTNFTTSDVSLMGYKVVRVTAPNLLINNPEAWIPWRDIYRLYKYPQINVPPMPHA